MQGDDSFGPWQTLTKAKGIGTDRVSIFKRAYIFVQDSLVGGPMTIQNSTFWHISNFCERKGSQAIAAPINLRKYTR